MNCFSSQTFASRFDRGESAVFQDYTFQRCTFGNCAISLTKDISRRTILRRIYIENCVANNCAIGPAIVEDSVINGLATNSLLILWGTLFRHVTLKGSIGELKINTAVHHVDRSFEVQSPFDLARVEFYKHLDWALDIRDAKVKVLDMDGIPASLIRRDPETQVVITRDKALEVGWRENISSENKYWPFVIDMFLQSTEPEIVLVAPKGESKKKYTRLLAELNELRQAGVTQRD